MTIKPIEKLDGNNFLSILDVSTDISRKLDMASEESVTIPLLKNIIELPSLYPGDIATSEMTDRYCNYRYDAIQYLKSIKIIKDFKLVHRGHRWGTEIQIYLEKSRFNNFMKKLSKLYGKKFVNKHNENKKTPSTNFFYDNGTLYYKDKAIITTRYRQKTYQEPNKLAGSRIILKHLWDNRHLILEDEVIIDGIPQKVSGLARLGSYHKTQSVYKLLEKFSHTLKSSGVPATIDPQQKNGYLLILRG